MKVNEFSLSTARETNEENSLLKKYTLNSKAVWQ